MNAANSLFLPDTANARDVDAKVRARLNGSFSWLSDAFGALDIAEQETQDWQARPVDFGFYFDLASAKYHGTETADVAGARDTAERLARSVRTHKRGSKTGSGKMAIRNLSASEYDDKERECLVRWFDIEPENGMALLPLDEGELAQAKENLGKALAFLETAAPEFWGELNTLTTEFIFAKPGPEAKIKFGGASAFTLWGAIALNGKSHPDWWDYIVRIVHEYSHSLLFGIAAEQELVRNDPVERYMSPLRGTPRPVDGIFHACYVSARQAMLKDRLLAHLGDVAQAKDHSVMEADFREIRRTSEESYADCMVVLDEHAVLTDLGRKVLDDTAAYMRR